MTCYSPTAGKAGAEPGVQAVLFSLSGLPGFLSDPEFIRLGAGELWITENIPAGSGNILKRVPVHTLEWRVMIRSEERKQLLLSLMCCGADDLGKSHRRALPLHFSI